jgi:hypothetical protein
VLPLYALLIEWLFFGFGERGSKTRRHLAWLFGVFLILPGILGLAHYLPGVLSGASFQDRPFGLEERLWTETRVLWHYLWWILAPQPGQLSLYHDAFPLSHGPLHPWSGLPAALGLAGLIGGAVLVRRRYPLLSFGILWFFVMQLLVSTVLPLELVFEHRNYLGSIGIFLALFTLPGAVHPSVRRRAEIMLQRAVALAPENPQMWINLINFQLASGQTDAAEAGISRLVELDRFGTLDEEIDRLRGIEFKQAAPPASLAPPLS